MKNLTLLLVCLLVPATAGAQELSGLIEEIESRTHFGIFTDVQTEFNDASRDAEFYSGHLVGHVTTSLSKRSQYFAEISLSPDGGHGGQASLERAFFQFSFSDLVRLRLGRIHTPVSFWNATYHHGQYLQTPINRPEMVKYSNRLSPIHSVVAEVSGTRSGRTGSLSFQVGAGASEDHVHGHDGDGAVRKNPAAYLGFSFQPVRPLGLTVGAMAYVEDLEDHPDEPHEHEHGMDNVHRQEIYSGYIRLERYRWTALAEVLTVANVGDKRYGDTIGYYVQTERQLSGALARAVLYGRFGQLSKNGQDPFFSEDDCLSWKGITTGVRLNVAPRVAVTSELRLYGEDTSFPNRHFYVQISAAF